MTDPIYPNFLAMANQGYQTGQNMLATRLEGQAINGQGNDRQAALSQLAGVNPQASMDLSSGFQKQQQAQDVDHAKKLNGAANYILSAVKTNNPAQIQGAWQNVKPYLEQLTGKTAPDQFDPAMLPAIYQAAGQSGGMAQGKTNVLSSGAELTDEQGNVLHSNPAAGPKPQLIQTADGGYVWATPGGGATPVTYGGGNAQVTPPSATQPPSDPMTPFIAQANDAIKMGAPEEQVKAWLMQKAAAMGGQPIAPSDQSVQAQDQALQAPAGEAQGMQAGAPVMGPQKGGDSALEQKIALARQMGATPEQIKGMVLGNTGQNADEVMAPGDPSLTGDAYLQSIPEGMRATVRAIANGDQAPPSSSSRSPTAQALLQAVYTYDPSASATNLPSRTATRKSFTSGKDAQNMTALSQLALHLDHLNNQVSTISGSAVLPNGLINNVKDRFNGNTTAFDSSANAVAHELRAVFANASGGTQAELEENLKQLSSSNSEAQKRAAVRNIAQLVHGRFGILQDKYSQGMGKTQDPFESKYPGAEDTILRLIVGTDGSTPEAAKQAQGQPSAPTSDAEYNALPSGATFIDPDDGKTYRKP